MKFVRLMVSSGIVALMALVTAAPAHAYSSQAQCEEFEGAGKCSKAGDGSWHRDSALSAVAGGGVLLQTGGRTFAIGQDGTIDLPTGGGGATSGGDTYFFAGNYEALAESVVVNVTSAGFHISARGFTFESGDFGAPDL